MGSKRVLPLNIWEIVRRFHMGQSINGIATALSYDRETVRAYVRLNEFKHHIWMQPACGAGGLQKAVIETMHVVNPSRGYGRWCEVSS